MQRLASILTALVVLFLILGTATTIWVVISCTLSFVIENS